MIVLLVVLPLAALLIAVTSRLGGTGRLRRNGMIGVRIPSTLASDDAWRAGHRAAAAPAWIGFGVAAVVAIVTLLAFGSSAGEMVGALTVVVILVVTSVWCVLAASRAARAVEASSSRS